MQKQKIAAEDCSLFVCWSKFSSSFVPRPHPTSVSYCKRWKAAWVGGLGARLGFSHIPPVSIFVTPSFHFHPFLPPSILPFYLLSIFLPSYPISFFLLLPHLSILSLPISLFSILPLPFHLFIFHLFPPSYPSFLLSSFLSLSLPIAQTCFA